jgi:hypothetical protein
VGWKRRREGNGWVGKQKEREMGVLKVGGAEARSDETLPAGFIAQKETPA